MLILQGLQGVSQQLAAFAQDTAEQFDAVDSRLGPHPQRRPVADRLSDQLTTVQTQLMTLRTSLSTLQSSVDRLHSEIELLFRTEATNNLGTITSQSIGYAALNTDRLSPTQFGAAAGALNQDATGTAHSAAVLKPPTAFAPASALGLGDLDPNINFFNLFPGQARDGIAFPGTLSPDCLDQHDGVLCLPDPDFWAASSRAYGRNCCWRTATTSPARG